MPLRTAPANLLAGSHPDVEVIRLPTNTGFAGGAQAGLDAVTTEYTCFLNNDAQADPGWLAALQDAFDGCPDVVAATSQILLAENGRINNAGGALTRWGSGYDRGYGQRASDGFAQSADVAAFCGAAAAVRTAAARQVGGFPAEFFLYYEDTDLSWRLGRAGGRIRYVPDAVVHHLHSATSNQASEAFAFFNQRNQLLMLVRNAPWSTVVGAVGRYMAVTAVRAAAAVDDRARTSPDPPTGFASYGRSPPTCRQPYVSGERRTAPQLSPRVTLRGVGSALRHGKRYVRTVRPTPDGAGAAARTLET